METAPAGNPNFKKTVIHKHTDDSTPVVSVLIVTYNSEEFLTKLLLSIAEQAYKNIEVILVDNASSDGSVAVAKAHIGRGIVIENETNAGFPAANNLGVEHARGKFIFLLNPDTFIDPACVEELLANATFNERNLYAPKQMTYSGSEFISMGVAADIFGYPVRAYTRISPHNNIRVPFYADGAAMFLSRKTYVDLKGMDEGHFLFMEDVELSWKAHLTGRKIIPVGSSIVYHFSGGSTGEGGHPKEGKYTTNIERRFLAEKNIIRNILKFYRWYNILWILPLYGSINVAEIVLFLIMGQYRGVIKTYIGSYVWNVANFNSTLIKRREIQQIRTVDDRYIIRHMQLVPGKLYALLEIGIPKVN